MRMRLRQGLQGGREAQPNAVRSSNREVTQPIVTIRDSLDDHRSCPLCLRPVLVHIVYHDTNIAGQAWQWLQRIHARHARLQHEQRIVPSQLSEVAFVANDPESPPLIERT